MVLSQDTELKNDLRCESSNVQSYNQKQFFTDYPPNSFIWQIGK